MSEKDWNECAQNVADMIERYGKDSLVSNERGIVWAADRIAELQAEVAWLKQLLGEYNEQIVTQEISELTGSQLKVCTPGPRHK